MRNTVLRRLLSGRPSSYSVDNHMVDRSNEADGGNRIQVGTVADHVTNQLVDWENDDVGKESVRMIVDQQLPHLLETSALDYDESEGEVVVGDGRLQFRLNTFPIRGLTWNSYYAAVSIAGFYLLLFTDLDLPLLDGFDPLWILGSICLLLLIGSAYERYHTVEKTVELDVSGDSC